MTTGAGGAGNGNSTGWQRSGTGNTGVGGATVTGGTTGTLASCPTTAITPTPLRRLTRFEYANTVKSLLNVDATPVNDLPADEVTNGYSNNAAVLTVSPLHAEKYVLVSEALAKAAVNRTDRAHQQLQHHQPRRRCVRAGLREQLRPPRLPPPGDGRGPRRC